MLSLRCEALSAMKRGSYATRTPITMYIAGWRDATTISAPHASTAVSEAPLQYTTALHALPAAHANWRCWATLYCMPNYSCAETAASAYGGNGNCEQTTGESAKAICPHVLSGHCTAGTPHDGGKHVYEHTAHGNRTDPR
jgi:hypothetical protein